jgi:predicted nucleic acid-binding protein
VAVVVLDASVVIAFLDSNDGHHEAAFAAIAGARDDELVLPASAYAEVLVGPYRHGRAAVRKTEDFITELGMRIEPLTRDIARRAAASRAKVPTLRLPDALVLATGQGLAGATILTADRAWQPIDSRVRAL